MEVNLRDQEDLLAKITTLSRKVESLEVNWRHEVSNITKAKECCNKCESVEHSISEFPNIPALKEVYHE